MPTDYIDVTEISGDEVTQEQVQRICNRYYWAGDFCRGKDVLEVACGTGQGMGFLNSLSKSFEAGDYSKPIIKIAKEHYKDRIKIDNFNALDLPHAKNSKDVIILFEAIYYLPDFQQFLDQCKKVLKKDGTLLIATANKDLFDFNPSPYTYKYFGVQELSEILRKHGFIAEFWGDTPVNEVSSLQRILRPVKKVAVALHLVPRSMKAKKILKRLIFGRLKKMPAEITQHTAERIPPVRIESGSKPDRGFKVIFCAAKRIDGHEK